MQEIGVSWAYSICVRMPPGSRLIPRRILVFAEAAALGFGRDMFAIDYSAVSKIPLDER